MQCPPTLWLQHFGLFGCAPLMSAYFHLRTHVRYTFLPFDYLLVLGAFLLWWLHCFTFTAHVLCKNPSLIAIHLHPAFVCTVSIWRIVIVTKWLFSRASDGR